MENHTPKHFVLQLGSLVSLYLSLSFLLVLIFGIVNLLFPAATDTVWEIESASSQVRLGIAMTFVFFPTYIILTRIVNKARRQEPSGSYLTLTKWLIYLSLLIGGTALLIDLVVVINTFLEGEITQRFILKATSVLIIVGTAFYYYLLDARGHWLKNEKRSIGFGIAASLVVLAFVGTGLNNIETPDQVREKRIDETQITDLQNIQWQIQDQLALSRVLPNDLEQLSNLKLPTAPEGRAAYRYELTEKGFKLCAAFATESTGGRMFTEPTMIAPVGETPVVVNPDNWEHGAGEWCFERVVSSATEKTEG